jgi:hypothetical protein
MLLDKFLYTAKAWAALIGTVLTALLATLTPEDPGYRILVAAVAVATALATYVIPNGPNPNSGEDVHPDVFGDEGLDDEAL